MPSLNEARMPAEGLPGYMRVPAVQNPPLGPAPASTMQPERNAMLRCPLPPLWSGAADSLRQFYVNGQVPQSRVMTPNAVPNSAGNGKTIIYAAGGATSGGGSISPQLTSSTPTPVPVPNTNQGAVQTFLQTGVLPPNAQYVGVMKLAKSFQLLSISSASAVRVEMYGSAAAQTQDLARGLDVPTAAGTMQGLIADIALDTYPYQWNFENRMGNNSDSPQTRLVYVTITNIGVSSVAAGITIQYVPTEK